MDIDSLSIVFLQQFRNPIYDVSSILFNFLFSYVIVLGTLTALYLAYKKRSIFVMLLASLTTLVSVFLLKEIVARPRPGLEISNLVLGASGTSFPSAHTAIAFTLAVLLSKYYPKYKYAFYTLAVFVALSRIYSGSHYLTDVIAGFIVGVSVGLIFLFKEKQVFDLEAKIHKQLKSIFKI